MIVALTRAVPESIGACELTHVKRAPIDWARADAQHRSYEALLHECGCSVRRILASPDQPDSVFVEDTAVVFDECAVIARPGAAARRAETREVAVALASYRPLVTIVSPGTLDGGDVLQVGRRVFVGLSTRTNLDGLRQLEAAIGPCGYSVTPVVPRGCLHLKSAATALDSSRLILNPELVDRNAFEGLHSLDVDPAEPFAANVVRVGGTLLVPSRAARTAQRLEKHGYRVRPVDLSELAKAEGALTCCSLLVSVS
jgi:dimethylargininase